jgi:hypothetical protein
MKHRTADIVLRHIRRLAGAGPAGAAPDRELLEQFAARRDEAAFDAILERHGPPSCATWKERRATRSRGGSDGRCGPWDAGWSGAASYSGTASSAAG